MAFQEKGDLNGDGEEDIAFVVQQSGKFQDELNREKIFAIYLSGEDKRYKKVFESSKFVPGVVGEDMFSIQPIEIKKGGTLQLTFSTWMSAGSWYSSVRTYTFRFDKEKNTFVLIGYDETVFNRKDASWISYSMNFLTKKMSITIGNGETGEEKTEWKSISLDRLKTIEEIAADPLFVENLKTAE